MLRILAATTLDEKGFKSRSPLAASAARAMGRPGISLQVAYKNSSPLARFYNNAIATVPEDDVLLFTHDDVTLEDWFLPERLAEALARFDVVGIAGNRRRTPRQCGWAYGETVGVRDVAHLSGAIGFVQGGRRLVGGFGPTPAEVKLLDGVFLAARAGVLREAEVEFDRAFPFHFYDLDFCRSCERAGLRMGTWPIAIHHESNGDFKSPAWKEGYERYLAKWGE